jgi:multidrug efflux system membrane fusion protein
MNMNANRSGRRTAFAALVATVLLAACAPPPAPPAPVQPVKLAQVVVGAAANRAVFAGEVKPRYENDLAFRIGGKIVARDVDVGTRVKKGQVIARLDPADVALQAEAAKAQVASAQTDYEYAKAEYERYENLFAQKFVSGSALDQKRNVLNSTRAKLEQAQAQQSVSRNQAGYATLVADQDGVITAVNAEAGQVVAAAQPVARLARESEREIAISVPENRLSELTGSRALAVVLWANPAKPYAARVREVAPAVDPVTRTFAVRVSVLAPDPAMQWGMTANVVVDGAAGTTSALLPPASIYHDASGKPAVWIYDPATKTVALRRVAIGQFREDGVVVTSGVANGEWVVAAGANKLRPGQAVRPYESAAGTAPVPAPAQG